MGSDQAPAATPDLLPYKDATRSVQSRVDDLLSRMTLAEKAGMMFISMIAPGIDGTLTESNERGSLRHNLPSTEQLLGDLRMNHFNLIGPVTDPKATASWYNLLQTRALQTRLGIPVTLSTDPRNHFAENEGAQARAGSLSQWPETLGFAALRDEQLVERFANIARQEYVALGIRCALSPQIDLATEYRWARINATFGEDSELSGRLVQSYIRGFQASVDGMDLSHESVSCMTKHFPGGGPEKDGEDSHFSYGKDQVYPGDRFNYHLTPFKKAIEAGTRQMMPYYSKPVGMKGKYQEEVGFAFHKEIITGLLREELGYQGIVCTDWGLITDAVILGQDMPARAWGCEHLTELGRVVKILDAGCDQFGGEARPELVVEAVEKGLVSEDRINISVGKLLKEKFDLGLFDKPIIDAEHAAKIVGRADFIKVATETQRRSYTLLTNKNDTLPLDLSFASGKKIYLENINSDVITNRGLIVTSDYHSADIALLRLRAPFEPRPGGFESRFHAGSLEFSEVERKRQASIYSTVPTTIVDLYLDRPAVVPEIAEQATSLLASYGSSVDAFLDVVFGVDGNKPCGKLPFDLPRSMQAVRESREDVPYDTKDPVFRFGHGLSYASKA